MPAAALEQQVFYPLQGSCKDSANRHVKVLNVTSVRSPAQLICTVRNDAGAVRKICERHQVSAPHACSEKERLLAQYLAEHGTAGAARNCACDQAVCQIGRVQRQRGQTHTCR